jgi:peptidyl-tRNA hydrolase
MPSGKLASQAGHAFLEAFVKAPEPAKQEYHKDGLGTKICLSVPSLDKLLHAYNQALALGLNAVLIEDTGRNTTFNGVPTVSAVGIGPITLEQAPFLKKFQLHQ